MRPHLALQASIIAFIEASRETSAWNEAASPPSFASFLAITTVCSAEARSLSTQKTLAPSCTKRMTVARPLPIPVPGPWPAPTTIAILSLRRMNGPCSWGVTLPVRDQRGRAARARDQLRRDADIEREAVGSRIAVGRQDVDKPLGRIA